MTPARTLLDEKGQETLRAWIAHGFAAKHLTRPDPEKAKNRAAGVLAALVTAYGDAFVALRIARYKAWCEARPTKVAHRVNHEDGLRRWCNDDAEKFAAQVPGVKPAKPDSGVAARASKDVYRCWKCGKEGRATYLEWSKHVDACKGKVIA